MECRVLASKDERVAYLVEVYWVLRRMILNCYVDFEEMCSCFLIDVEETWEFSAVVY